MVSIGKNYKLSVLMPVYNEISTVKKKIDEVLNLRISNLDIELIIIESNSTDGSKEIVKKYSKLQNVKIVFQKSPRGKGNAIRAGFQITEGDFILIQDSDDEYNIDDYHKLLIPLMNDEEKLVLGCRKKDNWKVRNLENESFNTFLLNIGHVLFTFIFNLMYNVDLKDPFTMYKVFKNPDIKNIKFVCNRFDFDFELLIKLIKIGYKPKEINIDYSSRSFGSGKKVKILRDPITWIIALLRFKF